MYLQISVAGGCIIATWVWSLMGVHTSSPHHHHLWLFHRSLYLIFARLGTQSSVSRHWGSAGSHHQLSGGGVSYWGVQCWGRIQWFVFHLAPPPFPNPLHMITNFFLWPQTPSSYDLLHMTPELLHMIPKPLLPMTPEPHFHMTPEPLLPMTFFIWPPFFIWPLNSFIWSQNPFFIWSLNPFFIWPLNTFIWPLNPFFIWPLTPPIPIKAGTHIQGDLLANLLDLSGNFVAPNQNSSITSG